MSHEKLRTGVRTLIVLVAACGAVAWAWRQMAETGPKTTTNDWVQTLGSTSRDERRLALRNLQPSDPAEIDVAVAAAEKSLADPDALVRTEAAVALARLAALPAPGSRSADPDRARSVARNLLTAFERDSDPGARASAASSLASIYNTVGRTTQSAGDSSQADPLKLETLVAAFDAELQRDPDNRVLLLAAFDRLGPVLMAAPPGLLAVLNDSSYLVRSQALRALAHFSSGVDQAVPVLLKDLATNTAQLAPDYGAIAAALHPSPASVPLLTEALKSDDDVLRAAAVTLLAQIEPLPRSVAPVLIAAVKKALAAGDVSDSDDQSAGSQPAGGASLAPRTGGRPPQPAPGWVSSDLLLALGKAAPAGESVPLMIQVLNRKSPSSRSAAATGLARLGPAAQTAIPSLVAVFKDASTAEGRELHGVRLSSAQALGHIGPEAPDVQAIATEVIAVLRDALDLRPHPFTSAVAEALGNFGPRAAGAAPRLRELRNDESPVVRAAAESALKKIEQESSEPRATT
jgi:HEAT repeat protein